MVCALDPLVHDRTFREDGAKVTVTGAEQLVLRANADLSAWRQVRVEASTDLVVRVVWFQGAKEIRFERTYTGRCVLAHLFASVVEVFVSANNSGPVEVRCQVASSATALEPIEGERSFSGAGETTLAVPPGAVAVSAWPRTAGETLTLTPFLNGNLLRTVTGTEIERALLVGADELHLNISPADHDWLLVFHVL